MSLATKTRGEESDRDMLFEHSMDAVLLTVPDGRILAANPAACELFGYTEAKFISLHRDIVVDTSDPRLEPGLKVREQTGKFRGELTFVRKDGTNFPGEISSSVFKDKSGRVRTSMIIRDISHRKHTEQLLNESEEKYRKLVENSIEGIGISKGNQILFANRPLLEMFGYDSMEEFLKTPLVGLVAPESMGMIEERLNKRRRGEPLSPRFVYKALRKNGEVRDFQISTSAILVNGEEITQSTFVDITERKRAEDRLLAERSTLRTLIDSLPDRIYVKDTECRFLLNNAAHIRALGCRTQEEVLGKTDHDFRPPEIARQYHEDDRLVIDTGLQLINKEQRITSPSGVEEWYLSTKMPLRDSQGKIVGLVGISRDITERKLTELALRDRETLLTDAQRVANMGHYVFDIPSGLWTSSEMLDEIFGIDKDFVKNTEGWLGLVHPDDQEEMGGYLLHHVIQGKHPFDKEYRIVRSNDGETRWFHGRGSLRYDAEGRPVTMFGIIQDITDRKNAEKALTRSEEFHRNLIENAAGVPFRLVFGPTIGNGHYEYVGAGIKNLFGIPAEDFTEKIFNASVLEVIPLAPEVPQDPLECRAKIINGSLSHYSADVRVKTANGEERWISDTSLPLRDERTGAVRGALGILMDITERKTLEKQLLKAQRLESLGTLAGGIAHDLNNVLGPILLTLDVMKRQTKEERLTRLLSSAESSALRGKGIVSQILLFARGEEGERKAIQPRQVLSEVLSIIRETFPRAIDIRSEVSEDLMTISANATQIHQVLMNLSINARDAMPNGGQISLSARNFIIDDQFARLRLHAKSGPYVVIAVSDTGAGIPNDILDRIFDPFFTTKEPGKGTGLGLATVHAVVRNHGGFVDVESKLNKGTTFSVYLPASTGVGSGEIAQDRTQAIHGQGETILVVDDEESIREVTKQTLENFGYNVVTAFDGVDGVTVYTQQRGKISAVITDVMMPVMDGIAMTRALRRINPEVKVLIMSGLLPESHRGRIMDLDIKIKLHKPFTAKELLLAVHDEIHNTKRSRL